MYCNCDTLPSLLYVHLPPSPPQLSDSLLTSHTTPSLLPRYGNVGRFLNHSCDPNLGKQAVYVDGHDLRAPHLAFFALEDIPAMQELTWDYGYKEGSVRGKTMPCHCGAANCGGVMY